MHRDLRGLALRGALGALMIGAGLLGAPAFAAHGHSHSHQPPANGSATNGNAKLVHTPTGTASLTWDKTTGLKATFTLKGLNPTGSYTPEIGTGTCDKGTALSGMTPASFTADAHGDATPNVTVPTMTTPIPGHGMYAAVMQGSTMVACGKVHDTHEKHNKGAQTANTDTASAKLGPTKAANQDVHGKAHLHLKDGTLKVDMNVEGLTAGMPYTAEIGTGTCSTLGSTAKYTLNPLTQNAHGDWTSTTTETGVTAMPDGQWYAAVWSGSDLLACGNVKVSDHGNHD